MQAKEITTKSVITETKLPDSDYVINPYNGCQHGCVFCYCREFTKRFTKHEEPWGQYVDAKVNAPTVIQKELRKPYSGNIFLSSLTDPYQPMEKKYEITRKILQELLKKKDQNPDMKLSILSRGYFVTRDIDLFRQFGNQIEVGFSINTLDDQFRRITEPVAASIERRFEQLKELSDAGVDTYIGMCPLFPGFTDIDALYKRFHDVGVKWVFTETFNTRGENWTETKKVLEKHYPEQLPEIERIFFDKDYTWYKQMQGKIKALADKYNIRTELFFDMGHGKF